jgi:hypothetical protein
LNDGAGSPPAAASAFELGPRGDRALHVDDGLDREVGDRRLRLGHPPRDDLLGARELLVAHVALGGPGLGDGRGGRSGGGERLPRARPGAAGGGAAATGAADASPVPSTSPRTIRPPGPLPRTAVRSMPFSRAIRRATGEALTPSSPVTAVPSTAGVSTDGSTGARRAPRPPPVRRRWQRVRRSPR